MLPKIHKPEIPGIPISSSNNHSTKRIKQCVDHITSANVSTLPSRIRDNQDFIKKMKNLGKIPEGAILATLDVCSLYTCIPNKEAIDTILDHVRRDPEAQIPTYRMGKLLEIILYMNHFKFSKQLYRSQGW